MSSRNGLFWIASSNAEISRARGVIEALNRPGVIDELGFLMLLGAFADHLYPAVTTVMTRARYLIFVPAIYQYLEQSRKAMGRDADNVNRELHFDLRSALLKNEDNVIGKQAGRKIVRTPSSIYWSGLGNLEIASQRISEFAYHQSLSAGAAGERILQDDDKSAHDGDSESLWDAALRLNYVLPDGVFPDRTSFQLRKSEAAYLEFRYNALQPSGTPTLIPAMLELARRHGPASLTGLNHLWEIPNLTGPILRTVSHAKSLSLFARGVTLQYYALLLEKKRDDVSEVSAAFAEWFDAAFEELTAWDVSDFFSLVGSWGEDKRPKEDRAFVTDWITACKAAKTGRRALVDSVVRGIIVRRENDVRRGKQRLKGGFHLEMWRNPFDSSQGLYQLDYRHRVGRQFAEDIAKGLAS
jgi:hypothetical protein